MDKIMKVYFDDDGTLVVQATDNTEMMALKAWCTSKDKPLIKTGEHLKTQMTTTELAHDFRFGKDEFRGKA
jgi:acylphosphatase